MTGQFELSSPSEGLRKDQFAVDDHQRLEERSGRSSFVGWQIREELSSIFGPPFNDEASTAIDKDEKNLLEVAEAGQTPDLVDRKIEEIEANYGVRIARPGETGPRQFSKDGPGKELEIREPTARELLGIEAALQKARPSQLSANGKALTFYFLKNEPFAPGSQGAASFDPDINGGPAVVVDPGSTDNDPIRERDRTSSDTSNHRSIESLIIHELSHNSEEKVFKSLEEQAEFYRRMGWATIPGMSPGPGNWMLMGRDGRGYAPPADGSIGKWERIDQKGRVTARIDPTRVKRLANEKPATEYFEGPHEMLAEGLTMLRLGGGHRTHLMRTNSKLYGLIKEFDQKEIDQTFGQGKFIRSYEGRLVPRTEANLKALRDQEESQKANQ